MSKLNSFTFASMVQNLQPSTHETYMQRCLELAALGSGHVSPNPLVGALLVCDDRIIGEGYHQKFGEAHAERNCIASVSDADRHLLPKSVMYVSLEPCAHHGKTPPCADLIIEHKIPRVFVGCRDPFKEVRGKGIEKLRSAGVTVECGILEDKCKEMNRRFLTFHTAHRPYIILKWAASANGKISGEQERVFITNEFTSRLVHKWRSEEAAIMVGTNTALVDDPELTTRLWAGNNPVRLVVDMNLRLPLSLKIFNRAARTIVFNKVRYEEKDHVLFYQVTEDVSLATQVTNALHQLNIQSVLIEGGARLLQSFIDEDCWDEARVITNMRLTITNGLAAPQLNSAIITHEQKLLDDHLHIFRSPLNLYLRETDETRIDR